MNFSDYDLGYQQAGNVVEVTLSAQANVRLLDAINFQRYRSGSNYRGAAYLVKQSPFRISVPTTGNWHVVIDLFGYVGTVRHSVRVISQAA